MFYDDLHDEITEIFQQYETKTDESEAIEAGLSIHKYNLPKYDKPFSDLPIKQRAMVILKLAMFTDSEIAILLSVNTRTVAKYTVNICKLRG